MYVSKGTVNLGTFKPKTFLKEKGTVRTSLVRNKQPVSINNHYHK